MCHVCGNVSRGTAQIMSRDVERYDDPQTLHNVNILTGSVCESYRADLVLYYVGARTPPRDSVHSSDNMLYYKGALTILLYIKRDDIYIFICAIYLTPRHQL